MDWIAFAFGAMAATMLIAALHALSEYLETRRLKRAMTDQRVSFYAMQALASQHNLDAALKNLKLKRANIIL